MPHRLYQAAAIAGVDESDEIGRVPGKTSLQLHAEAAVNALADAGIDISEVDGIATAGVSTLQTAEYLGITPRYTDSTAVGGSSFVIHVGHATEAIADGRASMDTLLLRQATCYTEAGKPAKGAALFAEVMTTGGLSRRDVGFFGARRATALALSGEPDEAAAVGLQAVQVARETNSERTMGLLGEVVQTLAPWSSRPGPRALKQAVSTSSR